MFNLANHFFQDIVYFHQEEDKFDPNLMNSQQTTSDKYRVRKI